MILVPQSAGALVNAADFPEGLGNELLPLYATVAIFRAVERASGLACRLQRVFALAFLGGAAALQAQPSLVSVDPPSGTTDFDVTQPVVFTFSEEMYPIRPLALPGSNAYLEWTGLGSTPVEYAWDPTSTTLTCTFPQNLPGDTQIEWILNPPGVMQFYQLMSFEWFEALPTTSGSFTTGEGQTPCDPDGIPDSYGSVVLQKISSYAQAGASAPSPGGAIPPTFAVFVESPADDPVDAASLKKPGGNPEPMGSIMGVYSLLENYDSEAELDAAHPGGVYEIQLTQSVGGDVTVTMILPSGFPPVPQVVNYPATQAIDPTVDFALTWNAFLDAGTNDTIALEIQDASFQTVFAAPDPCAGVDLTNADTTVTVPAGTLHAGQTYTATLSFSQVFHRSTETLPGFGLFGSIVCSTEFALTTLDSGVVTAPALSGTGYPASGHFSFTVTGLQAGVAYSVQASPTAQPSSWIELESFTADGSQATVSDPTATRTGLRFYRVVAP